MRGAPSAALFAAPQLIHRAKRLDSNINVGCMVNALRIR